MRIKLSAIAAAVAVAALGAVLLLGEDAEADKALGTVASSSAVITNGEWERLSDAGFRFRVCGFAQLTDGGVVRSFPAGQDEQGPCERCEPGAWNSAPATCSAQWKSNRGL